MAHARNDSLGSVSSLTSISSRTSVETYESLKEEIISIEQSEIDLPILVGAAKKIIDERFTPTNEKVFKYKKNSEESSINLDNVMKAMLICAEECGGQRYVASAIVACTTCEDVVEKLAALGTTWLTHFLFVFRASRSHENQSNNEPSELATPTFDDTASHMGEGVGNRSGSFRDDVMLRDGYTCVITGYKDVSHPQPNGDDPDIFLQASHILRRSVGNFDNDRSSTSFKSAVTTFDILRNFTRIPVAKLEDLHSHLDDPSNGMMLQSDAHNLFDTFKWCLKKTETENEYTLKVFNARLLRMPKNNLVKFTDHSDDFDSEPSGSRRKRKRTVALPSPKYISIHATLAGVLNMSGAGRFFDELLDRYKDDEGNVPPVRSWPELEKVMEEELLRESVAQSLRSVKVY